LEQRFNTNRLIEDLNGAIVSLETSISLIPQDHIDLAALRNNLGYCLQSRFHDLGQTCDLDRALFHYRLAVELTQEGHPDMPSRLSNLGNSFRSRFEQYGEEDDLAHALRHQQLAVELMLEHSTELPPLLDNYAISLQMRWDRYSDIEDLERALSCQDWAVELTPVDHQGFPALINNLGNALRSRFEHTDDLDDLDRAISKQELAVELTPCEDPDRISRLQNLGTSLLTRFNRLGRTNDLDAAILLQKTAFELIPEAHPSRGACLGHLATSIQARFQWFGRIEDVDDAISISRLALNGVAAHPRRAHLLSNMGNSLMARFIRLGEPNDLEACISARIEVIDITPGSHPELPSRLSSLGHSLCTRFLRDEFPEDIGRAIHLQQQSISLTPHHHVLLPALLNNLATSLGARFEGFGEAEDLGQSISSQRLVLELTPVGHPNLPSYLNNLANSLSLRFNLLGDADDLELAISTHQRAAGTIATDHKDSAVLHNNVGISLESRFMAIDSIDTFLSAISALRYSSNGSSGDVRWRFQSAIRWAKLAHTHGDLRSALDGYQLATALLPQYAWRGLNVQTRQNNVALSATSLAHDAATCAIALQEFEKAVELSDQGRSILWTQASDLSADLAELYLIDTPLAKELDEVGRELQQGAFGFTAVDIEATSQRYRRLTTRWEELVSRVRALPCFEEFLRPMPNGRLRYAASNGPVILINVSEYRCDALIITFRDPIQCIPLSNTSFTRLAQLAKDIHSQRDLEVSLKLVLCELWHTVVSPVLNALHLPHPVIGTPASKPRIWWCPTGPLTFLPIHAAGEYRRGGSPDLIRRVVSSYTMTLGALVRHRWRPQAIRRDLVAIGQACTGGLLPLPNVPDEIDLIRRRASLVDLPFRSAEGSDATCKKVLELLKNATWVHFACHATHSSTSLDSGLYVHDGPLRLSQIASNRLPRADFAFLSACHSASGSHDVPDEAMHIAAGMQVAGFRSVIASMWAISDRSAPILAEKVYSHLLSPLAEQSDSTNAAEALNIAVLHLRRANVCLAEWVSFVHIGV
jgi:tetratricopeptide (TPR) repeat protein